MIARVMEVRCLCQTHLGYYGIVSNCKIMAYTSLASEDSFKKESLFSQSSAQIMQVLGSPVVPDGIEKLLMVFLFMSKLGNCAVVSRC